MNEIRCRKLDCAKELAAVPIQEVAKIAAALARNPGSAAVKDGLQKKDSDDGNTAPGEAMTGKRRERVDEKDPLVEATAKTFELLEIAYQEKCRKSRESRCQELAALPIVEVAKIAVTFMCDRNTPPVEATAKALELLEIAYYGKFGLAGKDSYEAGLKDFAKDKKIDEEFREGVAKIPKWEWQYDEHGRKRPVRFDEGLKALMPLPGYSKARAKDERMTRFKSFLVGWLTDPNKAEGELEKSADAMIGEMKRNGIPPREFAKWLVVFWDWWKREIGAMRSASGTKGVTAKYARATESKRGAKEENIKLSQKSR